MEPFHIKPNINIAQIISNKPSENFGYIPAMFLGRYTPNCICRILFKFPITSLPEDAMIIEATFNITSFSNNIATLPKKITPYALIENWSVDTVNWNNQPLFNEEIRGESAAAGRGIENEFDITSIVRKWYDNQIPNHGIILKSDEIKDNTYARLITDINKSYGPNINIIYQLKSECVCKVIPTKFIEGIEEFDTNGDYKFSKTRDTSLTKTVTYFIENLGESSVTANLQISPDGVNFVEDKGVKVIKKNEVVVLIPYVFAKFTRLRVKNINNNEISRVRIWYQGQK